MTPQIDEQQDVTVAMAAEFSAVLKTWLSPEKCRKWFVGMKASMIRLFATALTSAMQHAYP